MSELLAGNLTVPEQSDSVSQSMNWKEIVTQSEFFMNAFKETAGLASYGRKLEGPYYPQITAALVELDDTLKAVHPALQPRHLLPVDYAHEDDLLAYTAILRSVCASNPQLNSNDIRDSTRHRYYSDRVRLLSQVGLEAAAVAKGYQSNFTELDEPPYLFQGDGDDLLTAQKACFNACYRMAFATSTGTVPHETAVRTGLETGLQVKKGDDEDYLGTFSTPTFSKAFPETTIRVLTMTGATVEKVELLATKIKEQNIGTTVVCIVNVQSDYRRDPYLRRVWHTNILLGATKDKIIVHDPSRIHGMPNKEIDKTQFHTRWAIALNRAHLIIAAPK